MPLEALRRNALPLTVMVFGIGALAPAACADTPAQARQAIQKVADRIAASYKSGDITSFMAGYSSDFVSRNVVGHKFALQNQQVASTETVKNRKMAASIRCRVAQFTLKGNQATAVLHWFLINHHARSSSTLKYTWERTYDEQTVWRKSPQGWQVVSADMTSDTTQYKRD